MTSNSVQGTCSNPAQLYFFREETQSRRRGFLWLKTIKVKVLVLYKENLDRALRSFFKFVYFTGKHNQLIVNKLKS
jgi:hypothetical protein